MESLSRITLRESIKGFVLAAVFIAAELGLVLLLQAVGILPGRFNSGSGLITKPVTILLVACVLPTTALAVVSFYFRKVCEYSWTDMGFRRPTRSLFHLLWQIPAAYVFILLVVLLARALFSWDGDPKSVESNRTAYAGLNPLLLVFPYISVAIISPLWEEILFRGALLSGLLRHMRSAFAVLISAIVFALCHGAPQLMPFVFGAGISLALIRIFHKNLWASLSFHALNNSLVFLVVVLSLTK